MVLEESSNLSFWLVEPNRLVHESLKRKLALNPIEILKRESDVERIPDDSISIAVMVHVLDHLLSPRNTLELLQRKMKPGGTLLLVTHDESSLLARVLKERWPPYCLLHPQLFNRRSLRSLLDRSGFQVSFSQKAINFFPLQYLIKQIATIVGLNASLTLNAGWNIPLPLGNIVTLARVVK